MISFPCYIIDTSPAVPFESLSVTNDAVKRIHLAESVHNSKWTALSMVAIGTISRSLDFEEGTSILQSRTNGGCRNQQKNQTEPQFLNVGSCHTSPISQSTHMLHILNWEASMHSLR